MKLSKEELKRKIDEVISDDNLKIELLEDIEDSMGSDTETVSKEEYEKVVLERDEIRQKYKERFLNNESEDVEETEEPEDKGLEEKEVIDVKEIFDDEEEN